MHAYYMTVEFLNKTTYLLTATQRKFNLCLILQTQVQVLGYFITLLLILM